MEGGDGNAINDVPAAKTSREKEKVLRQMRLLFLNSGTAHA